MPETPNPYIAGSPITGPEMFFGREDVFGFVRQALTGQHRDHVLVLYGQRRTGKTSVLYQMSRRLDERYLCIFIDLHGLALNGLGGFLWELANHITRVLRRDYAIQLPAPDRAAFQAEPREAFETAFLDSVWAAIGDRHLLLMLDEAIRLEEQVRSGQLDIQVFDYLRHLMQHYPRLNFLFSLGSGLEEMQKEYAFLFNVALYKKISFLDPASARALITEPVKDGCPYEPAAVERILEITSGHPYFTQLICHSLFNRCQGHGGVTVADVDAVLEEAVERGLAVLKHIWEESTPEEKAVLAAMAAVPAAADGAQIIQTWDTLGVTLPERELARAVRSLTARDVIVSDRTYAFTVDLLRLWVQKFRRLEWVKEEIEDAALGWAQREEAGLAASQAAVPGASAVQVPGPVPGAGHPAGAGESEPRKSIRVPVVNIILAVAGLLAILFFASALLDQRRSPPVTPAAQGADTEAPAPTSPVQSGEAEPTNITQPAEALPPPASSGGIQVEKPEVVLGGEAAQVSGLAVLGGYVWAATDGGLVRWSADGTYNLYSWSDLQDYLDCANAIVARPRDNTLWMGCGGVAYVKFEDGKLSLGGYYNRDDGLGMGTVRALALDPDGNVWAGGFEGNEGRRPPLSVFNEAEGEWQLPAPLDTLLAGAGVRINIRSLLFLGNEALALGLNDDGILILADNRAYTFGEAQGVGLPGQEDRRIRRLLLDGHGTLWAAASDQGLLRPIDDVTWQTVDVIPGGAPIYSLAEFADGSLWAGGDQLVVHSTNGGATWTQVGTSDGLGEGISALVQDEAGHIWAGSYGGGVSVWDDQRQQWIAFQQ